jgi:hypothetical protein
MIFQALFLLQLEILQANWMEARKLCQEKGMVQGTLKNLSKMSKVTEALIFRGLSKFESDSLL